MFLDQYDALKKSMVGVARPLNILIKTQLYQLKRVLNGDQQSLLLILNDIHWSLLNEFCKFPCIFFSCKGCLLILHKAISAS